MDRKSRLCDRRHDRAFLILLQKITFSIPTFRPSDPIHPRIPSKNSGLGVFRRDALIGFLNRFFFSRRSRRHPSKHAVTPHSSGLDNSPMPGWLLYCCFCCCCCCFCCSQRSTSQNPQAGHEADFNARNKRPQKKQKNLQKHTQTRSD